MVVELDIFGDRLYPLFADIIYFGILYCCRNPLYLGVIFVGFLLIKALWVQLDISGEFRNGAVSVKLQSHSLVLIFHACLAFDKLLLPSKLYHQTLHTDS
jgi:hypothetical protein